MEICIQGEGKTQTGMKTINLMCCGHRLDNENDKKDNDNHKMDVSR